MMSFLAFFSFFKALGLVSFYGLELVFKVSFRVRTRFRIRINNAISVWQLATTVAAILVIPIRHSCGFTFVASKRVVSGNVMLHIRVSIQFNLI